ncbi:hypothetical protein GXW83_22570 [Streptacidiphilus sp. PB12-B1b]|uniref:hypothetical protein n=1 Tax=Streptacidiphilus sp. PB12-B1b TaxID=2705012 RepID=UPI0015F9485C|nr:hypothetical protein [Streptacidiphilus sp. PB12-B1b]QMU78065.1 hypothetical protein GXW83_22570 [Streptacidiphilus sp. PB12-B1b]
MTDPRGHASEPVGTVESVDEVEAHLSVLPLQELGVREHPAEAGADLIHPMSATSLAGC